MNEKANIKTCSTVEKRNENCQEVLKCGGEINVLA